MSKIFDKVKDYFLKIKNVFIKPDKIHATPVESVDDVTPRISPQTVVEEGATFVITEGSPPAESPESIEPVADPVVSVVEILEHDGVVHALQITTETVDSPVDSPVDSAVSSVD
jgi:hypothetical protein